MKVLGLFVSIFVKIALALIALLALAFCILGSYAQQFDAAATGFIVFILTSVVTYVLIKVEAEAEQEAR